jgi:hypothetical protein
MQADFQQALADLTASPEHCRTLRADARWLLDRYTLTERERRQLLVLVHSDGMARACTLYRMNRLAPLAINFERTLAALGDGLRELMSAYWREHPHGHPHFFIESERFGRWLQAQTVPAGLPAGVPALLAQELGTVQAALDASLCETEAIA